MIKRLLLILLMVGITRVALAQDYYCYIRTYDRSGVTAKDDVGRSKKGDIVCIRPVSDTTIPSDIAQKEWLILKVPDLTKEEIQDYTSAWREEKGKDERGQVIFEAKAYRKNKIDISAISNKPGLINTKQDKVLLKSKISAKTSLDLSRYERSRFLYLAWERPFNKVARWVLPYAYASTVVSTINKSGEDYDTLTLWEDAKDGDLVTATTIQEADCYDDDGALDDMVTVDGSTTNSSYYIYITAPVGERHLGVIGGGFIIHPSGSGNIINPLDNYTVIEWLELQHWNGNFNSIGNAGGNTATNLSFRNLIVGPPGTSTWGAIEIKSANNVFMNILQYGGVYGYVITCTSNVDNTLYNCIAYGNSQNGFTGANWPACINCISTNNGGADYATIAGGESANNISEDNTAPTGGTEQTGVSATNLYVTPGSDFKVKAGSPSIDAGVDNGTTPIGVNIDILGFDRDVGGGTWDIGAYEYVAVATGYGQVIIIND
jgi:hypothetical protein